MAFQTIEDPLPESAAAPQSEPFVKELATAARSAGAIDASEPRREDVAILR